MKDRLTTILRVAAMLARDAWPRGQRRPRGMGPKDVLPIPSDDDGPEDVWEYWIDLGEGD